MTTTIAVIAIDQETAFFAERYFREIITTVSQAAIVHECYVRILSLTSGQISTSAELGAMLAAEHIDAVLVIAPSEMLLPVFAELFQHLPGVIISCPRLDLPLNYVCSDNYGAMRQIVEHVASLGRRTIGLLQPEPPAGDYAERRRGYIDAMAALNLQPLITDIRLLATHDMLDRYLQEPFPDALIAPDDNIAMLLLNELKRRMIQVPHEIALVGFDDEEFAADLQPALTTVSQPLVEMAGHATRYLLDRMAGIERGIYQEILPNRLIIRESTGVPSSA